MIPARLRLEAGGTAPGLAAVASKQRSKVVNLPVTTELWDSFSFTPQARAVSLSTSHWGEPTETSSPADKVQGIQSSPEETWTSNPHCLEGPPLSPKQNNTKQNRWVFIWAETPWSPLQAEGKCYSPMRHCRKQVAPFRSKDSFYFWLSKMESSVCATKEWNDVWAKASFISIHTKERI